VVLSWRGLLASVLLGGVFGFAVSGSPMLQQWMQSVALFGGGFLGFFVAYLWMIGGLLRKSFLGFMIKAELDGIR